MDEPLAITLFSGTDDKLQAAAVLTAGAAVIGRPVHVFLQYWGLDAFRANGSTPHEPMLAPEAGEAGLAAVKALAAAGQASWRETLVQAKAIGQVEIQACSLSMDLLHLTLADLDPLVDGVEGITAFWLAASEGQVIFI
jgi:peroxiredoxin family protein